MKNKRILYLMHIPWGWIKQRPHFIAEGLSRKYDVTVVCPKLFKKNVENKSFVHKVILFRFPLERFKIVKFVNKIIYFVQIIALAKKCDGIWVTSPSILSQKILNILKSKKIYYDCMDDMLEFGHMEKETLIEIEYKLYQAAAVVFCSSEYLAETLKVRYGMRDNMFVINNAAILPDTNDISRKATQHLCKNGGIKMVYIGTISKWFDFNLIQYLQDKIPTLELYLFGPRDVAIPKNSQIHYCGIVEHNAIFQIMSESDILIMPFVVTKLILSVNPVKLYEYIYSGRPCIAPKYPESLKFVEYVYLYENKENCLAIVKNIIANNFISKKTREDALKFVRNNTWQNRLLQITDILDGEN